MNKFNKIAIFAKVGHEKIVQTLEILVNFLVKRQCQLFLENNCSEIIDNPAIQFKAKHELATACDLAIVVGGDGTMLKASRSMIEEKVPVLGINLGYLGFLADIKSDLMLPVINDILKGDFVEERRQVLVATIYRNAKQYCTNNAINDVVLFNGDFARIIEFDVFVNDEFVMCQRADGIIVATATGSTAYSLSAGGPILHPKLQAMALVPMSAHTLNSRPIIISDSNKVRLVMSQKKKFAPKISCDGQVHFDLLPGDEVSIKKHDLSLHLIHPKSYNYYAVLQDKLGWNKQIRDEQRR